MTNTNTDATYQSRNAVYVASLIALLFAGANFTLLVHQSTIAPSGYKPLISWMASGMIGFGIGGIVATTVVVVGLCNLE